MTKECQNCLNVEAFDTLLQKPIRITSNGLCNQCANWEVNSEEFYMYRKMAKEQLPKIFKKVKSEKHEYDAVVCLSGGKDSSAALILAKEKYNLNVLGFTIDKGTFYNGVKQQIDQLTDQLGVDHVFIKAPKSVVNRIFQFGIGTLSSGGIQCKLCGGLLHVPIQSRFLLKYDIPIVITGLDLWEIYGGYTREKNQKTKLINPFLYTFPSLKQRWNEYQITIDDSLNILKRFSSEKEYPKLKEEFLQIADELITRYGLNPEEIEEFKKANFYDVGLPAIEISSKKQQLQFLEEHGWAPPKDMFTGEIIGTDCKIGGIINSITSFEHKRKMWSYRIRTGLVTKDEALEEITEKTPDVSKICQTLKEMGIDKLDNRLIGGWENKKFKNLYDINVINKVNAELC